MVTLCYYYNYFLYFNWTIKLDLARNHSSIYIYEFPTGSKIWNVAMCMQFRRSSINNSSLFSIHSENFHTSKALSPVTREGEHHMAAQQLEPTQDGKWRHAAKSRERENIFQCFLIV